jgi:hypothetical protein
MYCTDPTRSKREGNDPKKKKRNKKGEDWTLGWGPPVLLYEDKWWRDLDTHTEKRQGDSGG